MNDWYEMKRPSVFCAYLAFLLLLSSYVFCRTTKDNRHFPAGSLFEKEHLFKEGCKAYMTRCPTIYKKQPVCAVNYNGDYKDFANFCEMEYENCNDWRMWRMYKNLKC